jgi:hypothetical protein
MLGERCRGKSVRHFNGQQFHIGILQTFRERIGAFGDDE